jgi:exopolyphosphatase/pppGpp-phosphohydrolase
VRLAFKVGDTVSFFDETANRVRSGVVVEKNLKYVSLQDGKDAYHFLKVPYCVLNLENVNTDIGCSRQEKLSKNNLRTGDCVGFNKDGEQITGTITRLNFKTVSLVTADQRRWRVGYAHLYKIIDTETEHAQHFSKLTSVLPKNNLTH